MQEMTARIWDDLSAELRLFIRRRVSNSYDIDDLLQDVFIKVHLNVSRIDNEAKIRGWIYRIARNTIVDYYRRHSTNQKDVDSLDDDKNAKLATIGEIEEVPPQDEVASGLKAMVESLPDIYAQALTLVEFEGLSQVELAKRLGISVSGAKSRVQRGRMMLKEALLQCCDFEFDRFGKIIDLKPACRSSCIHA